MERLRNGKVLACNYPFQKDGISSLKFVPGICSMALDGNTNPGYLDVKNILSTHRSLE